MHTGFIIANTFYIRRARILNQWEGYLPVVKVGVASSTPAEFSQAWTAVATAGKLDKALGRLGVAGGMRIQVVLGLVELYKPRDRDVLPTPVKEKKKCFYGLHGV